MNKIQLHFLFLMLIGLTTGNYSAAQTQIGADIIGDEANDQFGYSNCMPDANTIAIGAPSNDVKGSSTGRVKVYSKLGNVWVQKGANIDGDTSVDQFGASVSMPNANTLAVGAPGYRVGNVFSFGQVRVFEWNGTSWVQKGAGINGEAAFTYSGQAISMPDENTVAIGTIYNSDNGYRAGNVRVFKWDGNAWVQQGLSLVGEAAGDNFGYSVCMPDATTLAIGAIFNTGTAGQAGHVRVFKWDGNAWQQKGIDIDGEATGDLFGYSVSMPDTNTVAIGAISNAGNGKNAGHVRVYAWDGSAWNQKGIDIDGDSANNNFGSSVTMPDANNLAVGALANSENGSRAGKAQVYSWDGTAWIEKGLGILGDSAGFENGRSLSMPDANTLAVGIPYGIYNGSNSGGVRVFTFCTPISSNVNINACFSYTSPSTKYTWDSSGVYMDTVQNAGGCDSVITINLTINKVDVTVTNSSPMLSANAMGASYQWLDCSNAFAVLSNDTNQIFTATSNGSYAVEITQNSCVDTSACETVGNVSIQKNSFTSKLTVYPNPTSGNLSIDLGAEYKGIKVTLKNALGQEISTQSFASASLLPLQINGAKGIYFIEIKTANHTALIKVIKE